jgi:hypothetical protein
MPIGCQILSGHYNSGQGKVPVIMEFAYTLRRHKINSEENNKYRMSQN